MNTEKQYKGVSSIIINSKKRSGRLNLMDNRSRSITQAKLISSIQSKSEKINSLLYSLHTPTQLKALTNSQAQGTVTQVAPRQGQYLRYDAWHMVQQKQGRVLPTIQMQGIIVNDNEGFQKETDFAGNKVIQLKLSRVIQKSDDEKIDKLAYKLYEQRKKEGEDGNPFEDHVEARRMLYGGLHGAKIGDRVRHKRTIKIYVVIQTNSDNIKLEKKDQPSITVTVNYATPDYELLGHKNITPSERAEILGKPHEESTWDRFKRWGLSELEISAMQVYTTSNYMIINRFLRADQEPTDEDKRSIIEWLSKYCPPTLPHHNQFAIQLGQPIESVWQSAKILYCEYINIIKCAIQKFPVPLQIVVRRGVNLDATGVSSFKAQHRVGATIIDKGFLSTSYQSPFASDSIIVIKDLPIGHPGRIISENSTYSPETEMLFPPQTGYTIERILEDKESAEFRQEMDLINPQNEDRFKKVKRIYLCKLAMLT